MSNSKKNHKQPQRTRRIDTVSAGQRLLILAVIIAVGIGGTFLLQKRDQSQYGHKDACALLTLDDAKSLLGSDSVEQDKVTAPPQHVDIGGISYNSSSCTYTISREKTATTQSYADYESSSNVRLGIVQVDVHSQKARDIYDKTLSDAKAAPDAKAIDGNWDEAFYTSTSGRLNIKKRNYYITIVYSKAPLDPTRATTYNKDLDIKVAKQVINRL